jgi:hypothetical protein
MEAATPLTQLAHGHSVAGRVETAGDKLTIHDLSVEDEAAARLVRERRQAGEDPVKTVADAIGIGARVLDREQAAANAEYVRTEFERASRRLESEFSEEARKVTELFGERVDAILGPENGQLARELDKLFSDGSSSSVQNRVRELVAEALTRSRQDLMRQFTAADGSNPLSDFKAGTIRVLRQAEERQHRDQHALLERMGELEKQLQALRLEKEKLEEVEAERERGTAKGRTFEEQVFEALDALAAQQGDVAEPVGDLKGSTGKTGDVVVAIDAGNGPARGRIVFEAKDSRLSRPKALAELENALDQRDADFAVLVVPGMEEVPARMQPLREYNGDKLIVEFDPADSTLGLELGYRLARARVLMRRADGSEVDAAAVQDVVQRALTALEDVRRVKSQLSGATTSIDRAREILEAMSDQVRAHLAEVDSLVTPAGDDPDEPQLALD